MNEDNLNDSSQQDNQNQNDQVTNQQPDPEEDLASEAPHISSTPLTPKPGEVVMPAKKLDVSEIIKEEKPTQDTQPSVSEEPKPMEPTAQPPSYPGSTIPAPEIAPKSPQDQKEALEVTRDDFKTPEPVPAKVAETTTGMDLNPQEPVVPPIPPVETSEGTKRIDEKKIFGAQADPKVVNEAVTTTETVQEEPEKPKKSKKGLFVGILIILIVVAATAAFVYAYFFTDMLNGVIPMLPQNDEVTETTESESMVEERQEDTTSVRYLDSLFKDLSPAVEDLRSDTNLEDILNVEPTSEF